MSNAPAPVAADQADGPAEGPVYEDWYLVEDYASLGVLGEAATGRGHRSTHEEIAVRSSAGAGGLYTLLEGEPDAQALSAASLAVWIAPPPGGASRRRAAATGEPGCAELLGDGMDRERASLWRRALVLGPAPEFCALGHEVPPGVSPARLPRGWRARTLVREVLWSG